MNTKLINARQLRHGIVTALIAGALTAAPAAAQEVTTQGVTTQGVTAQEVTAQEVQDPDPCEPRPQGVLGEILRPVLGPEQLGSAQPDEACEPEEGTRPQPEQGSQSDGQPGGGQLIGVGDILAI